jgi:hypothetical protein
MNGGPITPSGKAVVRWNATRHGISSPKPVVPGMEKLEDWEENRDGMLGTVEHRWGHPDHPALDVRLEDGRLVLFWFHELDEVS